MKPIFLVSNNGNEAEITSVAYKVLSVFKHSFAERKSLIFNSEQWGNVWSSLLGELPVFNEKKEWWKLLASYSNCDANMPEPHANDQHA